MERILVVEDDLALITGLCFELDNAGYLTVAAYNCTKAQYLLEHESFSLALLDVNLPDGNGFDLCREIKAVRPELPVIFLTANDLETDVLNGFDMGAEDYVTKPFNMQILLRRVEVALRRAGSAPAAPAADKWSDGWLTLDFSALTAQRGPVGFGTATAKVNGKTAKPACDVKEGDVIEITFGNKTVSVEVVSVAEHALKSDAASMYRVVDEKNA